MLEVNMNGLTFHEWMLLNGADLAKKIVEEDGLNGPQVDEMLSRAQMLDGPRKAGKKLLREFLRVLGRPELLPEE